MPAAMPEAPYTLARKKSHTFTIPYIGTVTLRQGESISAAWYDYVQPQDKKFFDGPDAKGSASDKGSASAKRAKKTEDDASEDDAPEDDAPAEDTPDESAA